MRWNEGDYAVSLQPCYRASCDAPGCRASEFFDAGLTTTACRALLTERGWTIIPWRVRPGISGAPRISYMCPAHCDLRPEGWHEARELAIRRLVARHQTRPPTRHQTRPLNLDHVEVPTAHINAARRAAMLWMLVEGCGTQLAVARAAGMTRQWVNRQVAEYEIIIERRQRSAEGWQEPWARRLRAAGAIP